MKKKKFDLALSAPSNERPATVPPRLSLKPALTPPKPTTVLAMTTNPQPLETRLAAVTTLSKQREAEHAPKLVLADKELTAAAATITATPAKAKQIKQLTAQLAAAEKQSALLITAVAAAIKIVSDRAAAIGPL